MTTLTYTIPLPPVPTSLPRGPLRGKPLHLKTYLAWRDATAAYLPAPAEPLQALCKVLIDVACKQPQKLTMATPTGGVDIYVKSVLDAVTAAGIWNDDKQVVALSIEKRYADKGEAPHTRITIVNVEPSEKVNYAAIHDAFRNWLVHERGAPRLDKFEDYVENLRRFCTLELDADRLHWSFQLPTEVVMSRWYVGYCKYTQPLQPNVTSLL